MQLDPTMNEPRGEQGTLAPSHNEVPPRLRRGGDNEIRPWVGGCATSGIVNAGVFSSILLVTIMREHMTHPGVEHSTNRGSP